jgi:predicted Zn-dependent peptidase
MSAMSFMRALLLSALALPAVLGAQERPDRAQPPPLGPVAALTLPRVEEHELANGLTVWLVESSEVPLVQLNLVVHAGSGDDPDGRFGIASLTAAMLDEGAGERSALEIADDVEFLGADLSTASSFDASAVRLNVPARALADALPIMVDVVARPTFPADELERLRQERLTALLQARDDPAAIAAPAFARVVFGDEHRYGTSALGTTATLSAFSVAQLRAFHAQRYRPGNATLIVVGDIAAAGGLPSIERAFGTWAAGDVPRREPLPRAPEIDAVRVVVVDMPGAEQSQIRIGSVGVARSTPDYFALQVLNTLLGGSFTSRLNQNLREEHGYAYGASSRFDMRLAPGPFTAAAGVQTDKTAESLTEFFNELEAIREPIGAEELAKAKNYLALGFPSEFETIGDLAGRLEEVAIYGLPQRYFGDYTANISAVTAAAVQRAAETHVRPDRLAVVIAGDLERIGPAVRALELGPLRVMTVEEALP